MLLKYPIAISIPLLCDWLSVDDLNKLDSSFCNDLERPTFSDLISCGAFVHNGVYEKHNIGWNKYKVNYLWWLVKKNVSLKSLTLNHSAPILNDIFTICLTDKSCAKLDSLELDNYNTNAIPSYYKPNLHTCPQISLSTLKNIIQKCPLVSSVILNNYCLPFIHIPFNFDIGWTKVRELELNGTVIDLELFKMLFRKCVDMERLVISAHAFITRYDYTSSDVKEHQHVGTAQRVFRYFPNLTDINLSQTEEVAVTVDNLHKPIYVGDPFFDSLARSCKQLTRININDVKSISDRSVASIAEHCSKLSELYMQNATNVTNKGMSVLIQKCVHLTVLELTGCDEVGGSSLALLGQYSKNLKVLAVPYTRLHTIAMIKILMGCPELTTFYADNCRHLAREYTKETAKYLSSITVVPAVNLHLLSLEEASHMNDDVLLSILPIIRNVKSLNLNGSDRLTDASIVPLIQQCTLLEELVLCDLDKITYAVIDAIIIRHSKHLRKLCINGCERIANHQDVKDVLKIELPLCRVKLVSADAESVASGDEMAQEDSAAAAIAADPFMMYSRDLRVPPQEDDDEDVPIWGVAGEEEEVLGSSDSDNGGDNVEAFSEDSDQDEEEVEQQGNSEATEDSEDNEG